jgi:AraC family transcriptional regulator
MSTEHTKKYYLERVNKVITYINAHLEEKLDLNLLAEVSCFSMFHFHRIMSAFLNESIGSYIIRVRMETAASLILNTDLSISEIALKVGYEIPSSFNKAFTKRFLCAPSEFKDKHNALNHINYLTMEQKNELVALKPSIKVLKNKKVIYSTSIGNYSGEGTGKAWDRVCDFAQKNKLFGWKTEFVGISHDDPEITESDKLRYDACITVSKDVKPEGDIGIKEIEGGKYAIFLHKGPYENFQQSYNYIYKKWLPESGQELRNLPCFEIYLNDPKKTKPQNLKTEIYIPIV